MEVNKVIKFLKTVFPWMVTIVCSIVIIRMVDLNQVLLTFIRADLRFLMLGVISAVFFTLYVCVYKYQAILKYLGYNISFSDIQTIKLGVLPMKTFLPFKSGEFLRAVYLRKKHSIPYSHGVYSIILGYILRVIILGILIISSLMTEKVYLWITLVICSITGTLVLFKHVGIVFY
ncbi:MAG: flippase-like domain-containing protein, partial [Endomicrobia bacterium]|nr:flippase-like domain-containing protein [Endomicrobiia bacterium]